MNPVSE
jgi:hypothetical protein